MRSYFTEMRVTVYSFGDFDAGVPINLGVRGTQNSYPLGQVHWTGLDTSNATLGFGSYKLRLDDKQGLDIVQLHDFARADLQSDQQNDATPTNRTPGRAAECNVVGQHYGTASYSVNICRLGVTWRDHPLMYTT